jgi:exodeoxyribonuclease-3
MKIVTFNANGIRSALSKGFATWISQHSPDIICLQELKAQPHNVPETIKDLGYFEYLECAEKAGYSGVGIYTKSKPEQVDYGIGHPEFDREGRYIEAYFPKFSIASIYFPSGSSKETRQVFKYGFMDFFIKKLEQKSAHQPTIFCGDFNIAHKEIDLKNWRSNQTNSGFLLEERQWMDRLLANFGLVDSFRLLNQEANLYTWWSARANAYNNNVGWRIDYQMVSPQLTRMVKKVSIFKEPKYSDHAPYVVDYDLDFS